MCVVSFHIRSCSVHGYIGMFGTDSCGIMFTLAPGSANHEACHDTTRNIDKGKKQQDVTVVFSPRPPNPCTPTEGGGAPEAKTVAAI